MGFIFDFFGSVSGYLLWFFFDAVSNYAVAIFLFALTVNIIMLPIAIKRQKNMANMSRLSAKQQELKKKYEKNPRKYNEEISLLYEKEGVNPMSGCFSTMVLPLIIWSGIFGAISRPLQNTLHIPGETVNQVVSTLKNEGKISAPYEQLQIVRNFTDLEGYLGDLSSKELADTKEYSLGFNLFGVDLLKNPSKSNFNEMLWMIPLLCFLSTVLGMYINQKISGTQNQAPGCMKLMPYSAALITTYVAYTMPAAVGFYWFINGIINLVQTIVLNKYYNINTINAKSEAARYALLEVQESKVTCLEEKPIDR